MGSIYRGDGKWMSGFIYNIGIYNCILYLDILLTVNRKPTRSSCEYRTKSISPGQVSATGGVGVVISL